MHMVDGALSIPVLSAGTALCAGGVALGLKRLPLERIPAAGVISAVFFVASLVHVPLGPSSVHLILNGMAGLVLGWSAFPALLVGLVLQALFFGFGGITVLGINCVNIAGPAVLIHYLCRSGLASASPRKAALWAGLGGALAVALTSLAVALSLALSGEEFRGAIALVFLAHLPVMGLEGILTGAALYLAHKVKPDLFVQPQAGY